MLHWSTRSLEEEPKLNRQRNSIFVFCPSHFLQHNPPNSPLQLTAGKQRDILVSLNGNLYEAWYCKHILLRLDEALADIGASYNYAIITIEHVLPQNPPSDSKWIEQFPDLEERERYVHRIGNLVLLSHKKNALAQNYDFTDKKQKYFLTGKVASFALTTQVVNESEWTPDVINRRQQELMQKLGGIWRLDYDNS